ncbi:carboxymuconolactone decarboxylase family protein [Roseovarius autotrophicus]|uniref:carboxymuconolactone decarboxylase family protein n=1 Tax=Roseovarius autotrophicus TaxID=2824121 RepID=UPI0019EFDC76|nr:carboxymuconolactone decarboxylase family protein [Roseovarius autotrophicus]MBE0452705.1 carboxymuconolactone decarboxylase family protein [Roseovarius sp.]
MTVSYVEREQANPETLAFYDRAEERFQALLNIFKVFGHQPEYGEVFTSTIMAILKDGVLDWNTKELLILKATQGNDCQYCVVQHERLCDMLGIPSEKVADIDGVKYRTSPHFTPGEVALLDFCIQIGEDANRVPKELWERLHAHWSEPQIVDAAFVITTYIAVSKFGDALGVALEPMFDGFKPKLTINH